MTLFFKGEATLDFWSYRPRNPTHLPKHLYKDSDLSSFYTHCSSSFLQVHSVLTDTTIHIEDLTSLVTQLDKGLTSSHQHLFVAPHHTP